MTNAADSLKSVDFMTGEMSKLFPDTDYVIAVRIDPTEGDNHEVRIYTAVSGERRLEPLTTDLASLKTTHDRPEPMKLLPGPGELLVQKLHGGTINMCVDRPKYRWAALSFTE